MKKRSFSLILMLFAVIGFVMLLSEQSIKASDNESADQFIDFSNYELFSYRHFQDKTPEGAIASEHSLVMEGNTWKCLAYKYTVTENTILEFDFSSKSEGDFHAIGFLKSGNADRRSNNANKAFRFDIYGTQQTRGRSIKDYMNYSGNGEVQHYKIHVGKHFVGDFEHLQFVNDHDVKIPTAQCEFRNVRIYEQTPEAKKPNVILIYTDDLGYGDISCNGAIGVKTPNIDNLASQGINFSDGHCSAATCTPSRFALLTGSYAFREKASILPGDAAMLISPGTTTLASIFKQANYKTAVVGKWHLGLGDGVIDWNAEVKPGPREIGFDYSFLIPATGDRVPCVYLENYKVVDHESSDPIRVSYKDDIDPNPVGSEIIDSGGELKQEHSNKAHSKSVVNGIPRIGYMSGGKKARWIDEEMADVLTHKANKFIEENKDNPFFLYFSTHDIHAPRVPHSRFVGKSTMGVRGDAIVQLDWCVGEVMKKLDQLNISDNTIIIFTSDNGPVVNVGYKDRAMELLGDHKPAGPYSGGKSSQYEGGTRVPFIVKWKGKIEPGTKSKALMGQIDLCATFASIVGVELQGDECKDSRYALNTLIGLDTVGRSHLIHENGKRLSLRMGQWKFMPQGSLFNLENDISESNDVSSQYPEKLDEMKNLVEKIKIQADGERVE